MHIAGFLLIIILQLMVLELIAAVNCIHPISDYVVSLFLDIGG